MGLRIVQAFREGIDGDAGIHLAGLEAGAMVATLRRGDDIAGVRLHHFGDTLDQVLHLAFDDEPELGVFGMEVADMVGGGVGTPMPRMLFMKK